MSFLGKLVRSLGGAGRRGDYYDEARRAREVPPGELAVVEAALAEGGPIADRVVRQLREAPHVWRLASEDGGYELRVSTTDALTIRDVPRAGWESTWIPVTASSGARPVELRITILHAGVAVLRGRTADGLPWPDDFDPVAEDLARIRKRAPWLQLPTPADLKRSRARAADALGAWLGQPDALRGRRGVLSAEPPASDADIALFEERERFRLPTAYRELLSVANGVEVGPIVILGTRDAYRLDIPGPDRLLIAPPNEDGALTLAPTGEVVWVGIDDGTSRGRVRAPDLRAWLLAKLTRRRPSHDIRGH